MFHKLPINAENMLFQSLSTWLKGAMPILLMVGAVGFVTVGVLGQFLFGEKLLIFTDIGSDTYFSYYAFYYFLTNYLTNFQLPLWSFKLGAGTSVLSLYQFLYDPFSVIFYLRGTENISRSIAWVFVLKTFCAAAFTYIYLRYLGVGIYARIVASILFAFNGFLMVWGQHYFLASWVIFLPLFLYTIEIWLKTNKWLFMALCVSFMALNIAIFFQMSVFCGLYILFRLGIEWQKHSKRKCGIRLAKFCGIYTLGLGISAVLWLPEYYLLKTSPRISVDFFHALVETISNFAHFNTQDYYQSLLARMFSNNLQGIGLYTGFLNYYESIQLYVGILPLLLLPQLYCVFSFRAKWAASLGLLAIAIFLVSLGFSQVMNGFQYPSYRWGYNVIMFELILAALVLDSMLKQEKINLPILAGTGVLLFLCVVYLNLNSHSPDFVSYKKNVIKTFAIIALIACYSLMLYFLIVVKNKRWIFLLFLLLICGELILEHRDSFVRRHVLNKGMEQNRSENYFDYGNQAVRQLKASDPSFYRIEKNHWHLSWNDSLVQDYFGLDSYNSLNTPAYINFIRKFGYEGWLTRVKWSSLEHPYLADILSVKYHLTKSSELPKDATYVEKYGDVFVYKRNSSLPFGFTYESYIAYTVFNQLSTADREHALIQGAVLEEGAPIKLKETRRIAPLQEDNNFRANLKKDVLNVVEMGEDKIVGNISLEHRKLLFLSIPFDPGWTAYINGQKSELHKVNIGFSGLYLDQGDNRVELRYNPPYLKVGAAISMLCLLVVIVLLIRSKITITAGNRITEKT